MVGHGLEMWRCKAPECERSIRMAEEHANDVSKHPGVIVLTYRGDEALRFFCGGTKRPTWDGGMTLQIGKLVSPLNSKKSH